jgi:hypothetical protein
MDTLATAENAKQWLDPWGDRVWEDGDGGTIIAVSRGYKRVSVSTRV